MIAANIDSSADAQTVEFTDRNGAEILKARIEAYWRERGQDVQVILVQAAFTPALRAARYDVRSEMTNGLPRSLRKVSKSASL
jgi:hypothetical protein